MPDLQTLNSDTIANMTLDDMKPVAQAMANAMSDLLNQGPPEAMVGPATYLRDLANTMWQALDSGDSSGLKVLTTEEGNAEVNAQLDAFAAAGQEACPDLATEPASSPDVESSAEVSTVASSPAVSEVVTSAAPSSPEVGTSAVESESPSDVVTSPAPSSPEVVTSPEQSEAPSPVMTSAVESSPAASEVVTSAAPSSPEVVTSAVESESPSDVLTSPAPSSPEVATSAEQSQEPSATASISASAPVQQDDFCAALAVAMPILQSFDPDSLNNMNADQLMAKADELENALSDLLDQNPPQAVVGPATYLRDLAIEVWGDLDANDWTALQDLYSDQAQAEIAAQVDAMTVASTEACPDLVIESPSSPGVASSTAVSPSPADSAAASSTMSPSPSPTVTSDTAFCPVYDAMLPNLEALDDLLSGGPLPGTDELTAMVSGLDEELGQVLAAAPPADVAEPATVLKGFADQAVTFLPDNVYGMASLLTPENLDILTTALDDFTGAAEDVCDMTSVDTSTPPEASTSVAPSESAAASASAAPSSPASPASSVAVSPSSDRSTSLAPTSPQPSSASSPSSKPSPSERSSSQPVSSPVVSAVASSPAPATSTASSPVANTSTVPSSASASASASAPPGGSCATLAEALLQLEALGSANLTELGTRAQIFEETLSALLVQGPPEAVAGPATYLRDLAHTLWTALDSGDDAALQFLGTAEGQAEVADQASAFYAAATEECPDLATDPASSAGVSTVAQSSTAASTSAASTAPSQPGATSVVSSSPQQSAASSAAQQTATKSSSPAPTSASSSAVVPSTPASPPSSPVAPSSPVVASTPASSVAVSSTASSTASSTSPSVTTPPGGDSCSVWDSFSSQLDSAAEMLGSGTMPDVNELDSLATSLGDGLGGLLRAGPPAAAVDPATFLKDFADQVAAALPANMMSLMPLMTQESVDQVIAAIDDLTTTMTDACAAPASPPVASTAAGSSTSAPPSQVPGTSKAPATSVPPSQGPATSSAAVSQAPGTSVGASQAPATSVAASQGPGTSQVPGTSTGLGATTSSVSAASPKVAPVTASGRVYTVTGSGFAPGELVTATMFSDPYVIGTKPADAQGNVTFTWTLPAGTAAGTHTVVLSGQQSGSGQQAFAVAADGSLSQTGATVPETIVVVALLSLAGGLGLMAAAGLRRRGARS